MSKTSLTTYKKKRNLKKSNEPKAIKKSSRSKHIFVIQQHHASRMHYDFRLEADGVLKSWAVPKGPSTNPQEKRLAAQVEDHPLDYAHFEGIIPEGYGAGSVIVWDTGTYKNMTKKNGKKISIVDGIERGHIKFFLYGKKLKGEYALTRFKSKINVPAKDWLLVKVDDEYADARKNPIKTEPESVLSGVTIAELDKKYGNTIHKG